jgi:hypothetical protein
MDIAMKEVTGEEVAELFMRKGLINTSKWITYALKTKLPDTEKDLDDVINSLKMEVRGYKKEYYKDSTFRESCFVSIWNTVLSGMSAGKMKFRKQTKELIPLMEKIIQTNLILEDIVNVAEKLEQKPKFYMVCFYYLILMESNYKNVKRNLYAMKQLKAGKIVTVTETLGLKTDKEIENEKSLKSILPDHLNRDIYKNLRNAIAHVNFQYDDEENKMEFWDINPRTQKYSLKPRKLTFNEFSKLLLEVNFFCEIFGFIILRLIACGNIARRRY